MQVQVTNDSSIRSKRSMVNQGYFKDDFINVFSPNAPRRSPVINLGYFVRATAVHHFINFFRKCLNNKLYQVLSLGAGFDTTYFRTFQNDTNLVYFEVDLPNVVNNKIEIITSNEETLNSLNNSYDLLTLPCGSVVGLKSAHYVLLAVDLENEHVIEKLKAIGLNTEVPTVVLSECAITYMEHLKYTNLVNSLACSLMSAIFGVYEQVCTDDGFGQVMMNHFIKNGTPLKGISCLASSIAERVAFFESQGWKKVDGYSAFEVFYSCVSKDHCQDDISCRLIENFKWEPFDEWEELYLKSSHYCLLVMTSSPDLFEEVNKFSNTISFRDDSDSLRSEFTKIPWEEFCYIENVDEKTDLSVRYSHVTLCLEQHIVTIAGVCHKGRSGTVNVEGTADDVTRNDNVFPPCCHTAAIPWQDRILLFGGRTSPANTCLNSPVLYDFNVGTVTDMLKMSDTNIYNFPQSRYRHSIVRLLGGEIAILFGGRDADLKAMNDTWVLSKDLNQWLEITKSIDTNSLQWPSKRFSHSACTWDYNRMLICGGLEGSSLLPLADLWCFNISEVNDNESAYATQWKLIDVYPPLLPRFGHTSHVVNGGNTLILIGGVNSSSSMTPGLGIVDLITLKSWEFSIPACLQEKVEDSPSSTPLLLFNHSSYVTQDSELIVITGGGGNCFSFGTHINRHRIKIQISKLLDLLPS